jgi:hypothetical protein
MPWYLGNSRGMTPNWWGVPITFFVIWSLFWTGMALWHAAKRNEKWWFILFFLVHTAGIVELLYLIFVVKLFSQKSVKAPPRKTRKK